MKVYILTDMEGISMVSEWEQVDSENPMYTNYRPILTQEVSAAVDGAIAAGATRIIVNDGHGSKDYNLIWNEIHPMVEFERPDSTRAILPSLDPTFHAMLLIGYHAMEGTKNAVLAHTQSHATWQQYCINGVPFGEIGQMTAIAGSCGVPVAYISGDRAAVNEARMLLGEDLPGTVVKKGHAHGKATSLHPAEAAKRIREDVEAALRLPRCEPFRMDAPYEIAVTFKSEKFADAFVEHKNVTRVDSLTVSKQVQSADLILDF